MNEVLFTCPGSLCESKPGQNPAKVNFSISVQAKLNKLHQLDQHVITYYCRVPLDKAASTCQTWSEPLHFKMWCCRYPSSTMSGCARLCNQVRKKYACLTHPFTPRPPNVDFITFNTTVRHRARFSIFIENPLLATLVHWNISSNQAKLWIVAAENVRK